MAGISNKELKGEAAHYARAEVGKVESAPSPTHTYTCTHARTHAHRDRKAQGCFGQRVTSA